MNLEQIDNEIHDVNTRIDYFKDKIQDYVKEVEAWQSEINNHNENIELFEKSLSEIEQERRDLYKLKEKTILEGGK